MKRRKIALWGLFGQGNIGNECTLQALIANLRTRLHDTELFIICTGPQAASKQHNLPSVPISVRTSSAIGSGQSKRSNGVIKLLRLILLRIPLELAGWWKAFWSLKNTDMLAMTGTGMLTDWGTSAFGYPYEILKWSIVARLRGCKVRFISVGVGPLNHPLSRCFIKAALSLADYRCYRDTISKLRMEQIGFKAADDFVFPDLAFSLPNSLFSDSANGKARLITVGVMDYRGQDWRQNIGEAIYQQYLEKTCDFIGWLVQQKYTVRIAHGDVHYDSQPRKDLRARLEKRGFSYSKGQIIDEDILSVSDLVSQLASVKMVISPRFHNQLLALMLGKPVISISYDPKSDALLEGVGLGKYCQPIEDLDVGKLIEQFEELESRFADLRPGLRQKTEEYRKMLDEQYRLILSDL